MRKKNAFAERARIKEHTAAEFHGMGRTGVQENLRETLAAIGKALPATTPEERGRLRHRQGYIAFLAGDVRTKALESFTLAREDAVVAGDRQLEALACVGLSFAHDHVGQRHTGLRYARVAQEIAESAGDQRVFALALNAEAQFFKENGENERANRLFRRMEEIGRELNDDRLVMGALIGIGRTTKMSCAPEAIAQYEKAIGMAKAAGDEATLAVCYNNLADWKIYTGSYREAIEFREKCLAIGQKLGSKSIVGRALIGMAKAYTLLRDFPKAKELLDRGFPTVLASGDLEGDLHSCLNLAYLYVQSGDIPRAADLYRQTLERSLAAPDHSCAIFAAKALDLLAEGRMPRPGILPGGVEELSEIELKAVAGGEGPLEGSTYPTGDKAWGPG
jgi:tetratricopeptide (TPR) repeat protein